MLKTPTSQLPFPEESCTHIKGYWDELVEVSLRQLFSFLFVGSSNVNRITIKLRSNFSMNRFASNRSYMLEKNKADPDGLGPQKHTLVYEPDKAQTRM